MSVDQLRDTADEIENIASSLKDRLPNYTMALNAGIKDISYDTVRHGKVFSFSGEATFEFEGQKWRAVGHRPRGNAESVFRDGFIEFFPI